MSSKVNKEKEFLEFELQPINISFKAELLPELNPELCQYLKKYLPYSSLQFHSYVAGYQIIHCTPVMEAIYVLPKTAIPQYDLSIGQVSLLDLELLTIKYGEVTEPLTANPVAQVIDKDIDILKKAGRLVWDSVYKTKEIITTTVRIAGDLKKAKTKFSVPEVMNNELKNLLSEIYEEINSIWITPPKELVNIYKGIEQPGIGTYGQAFSTMIFVKGELGNLSCSIGSLLNLACNKNNDLDCLRNVYIQLSEVTSGFLGYCGLQKLDKFSHEAIKITKEFKNRSDYIELFKALALYVNKVHLWSLHLLPWKYGANHPVLK